LTPPLRLSPLAFTFRFRQLLRVAAIAIADTLFISQSFSLAISFHYGYITLH